MELPVPGEDSLFDRTFLPHLDAAYNLARWLVKDDAAAQDVVQDSFLRALRFHHARRNDDVLPWLLQIVRNTAYSWLKRHRQRTEPLDDETPLADAAAADPAAALVERIDVELLLEAVDALPDEFREAIVLRELQGLSYKEIAAATETSIGTVMSRLARARRRLQAALAPELHKEHDHGL